MIRSAFAALTFLASTNAQFELDRSDEGAVNNVFSTSGTVEFSTEQVFDGDTSVKFTGSGGGFNRNRISFDLSGTGLQTEMYGSAAVWVDGGFGINTGDFTFVQADGVSRDDSGAPAGTTVNYRYRASGDGAHDGTVMANYDTNNGHSTDCYDHGDSVRMPRETWTCVEWHFNADTNTLEYWLDGSRLNIEITGDGPGGDGCIGDAQDYEWTGPQQFDTLHIGVEQYDNNAQPRTFFIDALDVSDLRIGCPQASTDEVTEEGEISDEDVDDSEDDAEDDSTEEEEEEPEVSETEGNGTDSTTDGVGDTANSESQNSAASRVSPVSLFATVLAASVAFLHQH